MTDWKPPTENAWIPGSKKIIECEPRTSTPTVADSPNGGLVKAWSASNLDKFDKCPHSVFLAKVKKIKEVSGEAADRGTAIHTLAEEFIIGKIGELPTELERYAHEFEKLRVGYEKAEVTVEEDWAFDINWNATGWMAKDCWARMKLDACHLEDETSGKVIDFKTGKKWGNEIKHNRQAMIYAIGAFKRYPALEFVKTEFWYLDQKDGPLINSYPKASLKILQPRIDKRAIRLTSCTDFPPNPSESNCRWCSYANDGSCEWSHQQ